MILDSLDMVDEKVATVDASTAPSDGIAWNAMGNFDNEIQSPFTAEGIDSILRMNNLNAEITLIFAGQRDMGTAYHTSFICNLAPLQRLSPLIPNSKGKRL